MSDQEYVFEVRSLPFVIQVSVVSLVIVFFLLVWLNLNLFYLLLTFVLFSSAAYVLSKNMQLVISSKEIKAFNYLGKPHSMKWKEIDKVKVFGFLSGCQYLQLISKAGRKLWLPVFMKNRQEFKPKLKGLSIPQKVFSEIKKACNIMK